MYKICVVGTGYVGLVTGACLADFGNQVTCVDSDSSKIAKLRKLTVPFFEYGLEEIVKRNVREGRLSFSESLKDSVRESLVIFIAVGTPTDSKGETDLGSVKAAAAEIGKSMNGYRLIVEKSTVPVGTSRMVEEIVRKSMRGRYSFDVASNPEFLREGSAVENFLRPDRVVIGTRSKKAEKILSEIYRPLYLIETPMVKTNVETAELIKYASNAFLATKVSFINEVAVVCEKVNADVQVVAKGMGLDRRIGPKFLHAGPGYGGSCFPKDTKAFIEFSSVLGLDLKIVKATIEANNRQKKLMVEKISRAISGTRGKTICVLGLSFKPETDDVREAPSIYIIKELKKRGAKIKAFDPVAMPSASQVLSGVEFCANSYDAAKGSHCVVIVTEWNEFRRLDFAKLKRIMKTPVLVDLRNVYDPEVPAAAGFKYFGVGR
ncbi:MAG: UDP-glucose/GDP-mannose dehydrogenase family protein [Candidatus Eisenbacteria bacterium]|nr:UDP-glucose/GDP-mannose dehydrogenase family protein [Candidatus Eisenbacteria bacterium]